LQVDLKNPDQQIGLVISQNCSEVGRVTSVKVYRSPSPFALIEMSTQEQTHEVASRHGGSSFGSCALIHLEQKP
jgi:hypothetical protein